MGFKRVVPTCVPGHNCSDEEINALVIESNRISRDDSVKKYLSPTTDELRDIITVAENYDGEWYHASVCLEGDRDKSDTEYESLVEQLTALGADGGVYLTWWYDIPELDEIFNKKV